MPLYLRPLPEAKLNHIGVLRLRSLSEARRLYHFYIDLKQPHLNRDTPGPVNMKDPRDNRGDQLHKIPPNRECWKKG